MVDVIIVDVIIVKDLECNIDCDKFNWRFIICELFDCLFIVN